ncbi:uncharacterized protein SCHCODRAFT_02628969, partial [Schizophyllum commune H4-8]|uniref:uncharacterized protein n=1 Tax=Schizophyllum commune (strain H4-8 / FGSC 9210) TaxID=578458 RepID=UPI00215E2237
MVRCEFRQGSTEVAYGSDPAIGYFFSVCDSRIAYQSGSTAEVNSACEAIDYSGDGAYVSLTTGLGIGKKVSKEAMAVFWERFGVPQSQIERLRGGQVIQQM